MRLGLGLSITGQLRSSAFSPAVLFAADEPGVWYDPSDLDTLYQDTAGTTPVTTPGQTVALMLDKSQGLTLGPELVTNGTFDTDTSGWTNTTATTSVVGGEYRISAQTSSPSQSTQTISGFVVGRTYEVTATYRQEGSGRVAARVSLFGQNSPNNSTDTPITATFKVVATVTSATISLQSFGTADTISIFDNISVRELPGFHATQATAAARPTYGIVPATGRRNLLTRTEEFDDGVWSKSAITASVSGDAFKLTPTTASSQHVVFRFQGVNSGENYTFAIDVKPDGYNLIQLSFGSTFPQTEVYFNASTGAVGTIVGSGITASISDAPDADGFYRCVVSRSASGTGNGVFYVKVVETDGAASFVGDGVSGVLVRKPQLETGSTATAYQRVGTAFDVTEAGVPSLGYLSFDGVDDFMVTPTITPGVDKVQVFAGVRKLSDAAGGGVASFGIVTSANGSFEMRGPRSAANNYMMASRGTSISDANAGTFTAPITNIITGLADISADLCDLRVDGVSVASPITDQGTGNYLDHPMFVGALNASALRFNGHIYSLVTRFGDNLETATIEQVEEYTAGKTGVDL